MMEEVKSELEKLISENKTEYEFSVGDSSFKINLKKNVQITTNSPNKSAIGFSRPIRIISYNDLIEEESFEAVEEDYEIKEDIETNNEDLEDIDKKIKDLNISTEKGDKQYISKDELLKKKIFNYLRDIKKKNTEEDSKESINLLRSIIRNIIVSSDDKYKKIPKKNQKIIKFILNIEEAKNILMEANFVNMDQFIQISKEDHNVKHLEIILDCIEKSVILFINVSLKVKIWQMKTIN
jgi:hypothetical protein